MTDDRAATLEMLVLHWQRTATIEDEQARTQARLKLAYALVIQTELVLMTE